MKTQYAKPLLTFTGLLAIFILVTVMAGCGRKPMASNATVTDKVTLEQNTNNTTTQENAAINDTLTLVSGEVKTGKPDCDTLCQAEVDRLLTQLQHQKTSGGNSYGVLYDKHPRLLKMYANLAATKNITVETIRLKTVTDKYSITKTVTKSYTPWYMRYSAYVGWLAAAYLLYKAYSKLNLKGWLAARIT